MPYGVVLKDERRTSNNDVAPLLKLFQHRMKKQRQKEKQRFRVQGYLVAVFPTSDFWLLTSVSSSFPIRRSMLDVRCSMFIFFSPSWAQTT